VSLEQGNLISFIRFVTFCLTSESNFSSFTRRVAFTTSNFRTVFLVH
jgi:hypothetical protein